MLFLMLTLESLLRIPRMDNEYDFDISPDGSSLILSCNVTGRWELYELNLVENGYAQDIPKSLSALKLLTRGGGAKFAPSFSPDGGRVAYAVDADGSENNHLFLLDRSMGLATDLTPDVAFSIQAGFSWSPGGQRIALAADRDGCYDAFIIRAEPGAEFKKVFSNNHPCWPPKWSPDGQWMAIEVEWQASKLSIFLKNMETGARRQIGGGISAKDPCWSPDGKSLAFCSDESGFYQIGIYSVADESIEWLTNENINFENPTFGRNGKKIICTRQQGAKIDLELIQEEGRRTCKIESGTHSHTKFTRDNESVLCVFENLRRPPNLWQLQLESGQSHQLTSSLPTNIQVADFPTLEEVTYPGMDGVPVPALLYRTKRTPAPSVILIHGGPNWYDSNSWYTFVAYCGLRGWAVLTPNYRGSTGYGRDWEEVARFDYGGVDSRDVAAGARWLIQQGIADPDRVAVTGASHGGYLTMTCLTQFPDLWAAGSALVPFLNWFTAHETAREDLQFWDLENMGDPQENEALWRERSPFFFLDRIQAPVQLICGANDPRCPASESIAARDRLVALGKEVALVLYEDEGHGFLKLETILDSEKRRIEFLAKALEG